MAKALLQLFLLFTALTASSVAVSITKTWNGCVTRNEKVVLAARVASDDEIQSCTWVKRNRGNDELYSSEDRERDGVLVEVNNDGSLCRLIVDRADRNRHGGDWAVRVLGQCDGDNRRNKRSADDNNNEDKQNNEENEKSEDKENNDNKEGESGSLGVQRAGGVLAAAGEAVHRGGLATRLKQREGVAARHRLHGEQGDCANHAMQDDIKLNVVDSDRDLCVVAGQERVYGAEDDEVVISARVNSQPRSCTLRFDRREAVQVSDVSRERCNRGFVGDATVCCTNSFSNSDRIFACNCRIEITSDDLAGRWEIAVENNERRREAVRTDVVVYQLPRRVLMRYDGREVRDSGRIRHTGTDAMDIECELDGVDGGGERPRIVVNVGQENLAWLRAGRCQRTSSRDECAQFDVMPNRRMLSEGVCCVAYYKGLDTSEHRDETRTCANADFDDYAASLVSTSRRRVRVCDSRARIGDRFETEIVFDAKPKPDRIEWTFRARRGTPVTVEEGRERGDYAAYILEENDDERDRYGAAMKIERLTRDDLNVDDNILLEIENDVGRVEFEITIDNTDECESKKFDFEHNDDFNDDDDDDDYDDDDDDDFNNDDRYTCNVDRDSDCRCNGRSGSRLVCCDNSFNCRGSRCCEACRSSSDRDCDLCDSNNRRCMRLATNDAQGFRCDVRDEPDCRCDSRSDTCCNADRNCRGKNCCGSRCNDRDNRDCIYCDDRGRDCYTLATNAPSTDVCDRDDRDCVCVEGPDRNEYCCVDSSSCRGRNCCDFCRRGDDNCYCDRDRRNCVVVENLTDDDDIEERAKNIMLDSCIKLSRTLLDYWQPDGDRRDSVPSEREVSEDIDSFFTTARCTGFDDDIREYAEGDNFRSSPFSRDHRDQQQRVENFGDADLAFQSLKPGNKVQKVTQASRPVDKVALSPQAQTILDLADSTKTSNTTTKTNE